MASRRLIISIGPTGFDLAAVKGAEVVASLSERGEPRSWDTPWSSAFEALSSTVREFVTAHGLRSAPTVVVAHGPTSHAGVTDVPTSVPHEQAFASARLSLASASEGDLDSEVFSDDLAVDAPGVAEPRRHVLSVSESDAVLSAIESSLAAWGLRHERTVVAESLAIRAAASRALSNTTGASAALWVGEHGSVLAASKDGRLLFVRQISVGCESFVDALTRPLRRAGDESPTACVPRAHARRLIAEIGFPAPAAPLPGIEGYTGAAILPVLQPLVQRIGVEIKQSLRFAIGADARGELVVALIGPGASIPGCDAAIARQTGMSIKAERSEVDSALALVHLASRGISVPVLRSVQAQARTAGSTARRAVLAGVGAALAITVFQWGATLQELSSLRSRASEGVSAELTWKRATLESVREAEGQVKAVRARLAKVAGTTIDPASVWAAAASVTPEGAWLTDVQFSGEAKVSRLSILGKVDAQRVANPAETIRTLVRDLGQIPLVSSVRLGRTNRAIESGREVESFEVTAELVGLPAGGAIKLGSVTP
ncbi:MAG: hypothetical protein SFY95_10045 [Planctomycetota bacterium]|nr:hypothetical protein [Planctomycetota bacterium]